MTWSTSERFVRLSMKDGGVLWVRISDIRAVIESVEFGATVHMMDGTGYGPVVLTADDVIEAIARDARMNP